MRLVMLWIAAAACQWQSPGGIWKGVGAELCSAESIYTQTDTHSSCLRLFVG